MKLFPLLALLLLGCADAGPNDSTEKRLVQLRLATDGQLPATATASDSARFYSVGLVNFRQIAHEMARENAALRAHEPMQALGRCEDENDGLRAQLHLPPRPES
jgi:hypothetical protein